MTGVKTDWCHGYDGYNVGLLYKTESEEESEISHSMLACTFLVLALWLPSGLTFSMFRSEIPNGDHVPHPCKPNFLWHGVGHRISQGGGPRNPFGEDFANNGNVWNSALCRKDSDGDGLTNGQELGDPDCVWTKGQLPQRITDITHPGVCDPWNEGDCVDKNSWLDCSRDEEFVCDYINDPNVLNVTLRFPRTKVPAKETTYICFTFDLPDDREYHLIATQPLIDNENVMHHLSLTGCDSSVQRMSEPQECLMGTEGCAESIGFWTLGMTGQCYPPDVGFRFGKNSSRLASMQLHWTNPREVDTWYDSTGIIIYYTPKLRRYEAATMGVGQMYLNIPPGQPSVVQEGTCSSRCTNKFLTGPIHVFAAINHMHYLGTRQNVTLKRAGGAMEIITDDNPYNYDSPKVHKYDPPITVHPGDELKTYCTFQSRSRTKTTTYGEGSFDEMCFSFLIYYPARNLVNDVCYQWKDQDMCDMFTGCDFASVVNSTNPSTSTMIDKILDSCDPAGTCRAECPAAIAEVRAENTCFRNMWGYLNDLYMNTFDDVRLAKFAAAMESCGGHHHGDVTETTQPPMTATKPHEPTTSRMGFGSLFLNLIKNMDVHPLLQNIIMNVNYNNYGRAREDDDNHTKM